MKPQNLHSHCAMMRTSFILFYLVLQTGFNINWNKEQKRDVRCFCNWKENISKWFCTVQTISDRIINHSDRYQWFNIEFLFLVVVHRHITYITVDCYEVFSIQLMLIYHEKQQRRTYVWYLLFFFGFDPRNTCKLINKILTFLHNIE